MLCLIAVSPSPSPFTLLCVVTVFAAPLPLLGGGGHEGDGGMQTEEGITGLGSRVSSVNVSGIFCHKQKGDKRFHCYAPAQETLCSPLHCRPGLSPCNLSPINVVCLIVSVDLDPGYQMVARYCGVTCHVSRAVMTRASTQSPRRACTLHVKLLCMYQPR